LCFHGENSIASLGTAAEEDKKRTALTQSGPWGKQAGIPDSAIDSASQKHVTVWRVFPDSPGTPEQAAPKSFGEIPFPAPAACRLLAVLMGLAPLSERSNFFVSYHDEAMMSTVF
jgi:hypothetical protein